MIIVKIELHSAVTGKVTEIGRMSITNDGTGLSTKGNYDGVAASREPEQLSRLLSDAWSAGHMSGGGMFDAQERKRDYVEKVIQGLDISDVSGSVMRRGTQSVVQRNGKIENYPRLSYPIWTLVKRMLDVMKF